MSFSRRTYHDHGQNAVANHRDGDWHRFGLVGGGDRRRPLVSAYHGSGPSCGAIMPPLKRRRTSSSSAYYWENDRSHHDSNPFVVSMAGPDRGSEVDGPSTSNFTFRNPASMIAMAWKNADSCVFPNVKSSEPVKLAVDEDPVFMTRDEIESSSPSRKDGIDILRETHLRYSYCTFLQNLGLRLELPQTTIGTAMVLCHRFFVHRSHASHDRFLVATAALFLAGKSEETSRPLNDVVRASNEICNKLDVALLPYMLPTEWFEKYKEQVIEAEQMILTTLDFELNVQHPYTHLTSVLSKLGFSQSLLVNLAWNLISEGVMQRIILSYVVFLPGGLICCSCKGLFLTCKDVGSLCKCTDNEKIKKNHLSLSFLNNNVSIFFMAHFLYTVKLQSNWPNLFHLDQIHLYTTLHIMFIAPPEVMYFSLFTQQSFLPFYPLLVPRMMYFLTMLKRKSQLGYI